MRNLTSQRGLTLISLATILFLIGFFTLLILKIGPIYMNHGKVMNAMAAVEKDPDLLTMSREQIKNSFDKRFNINYVDHISSNDLKITKRSNYVKVELQYEVVEKIFGNLSVLVEFDEHFEVGEK